MSKNERKAENNERAEKAKIPKGEENKTKKSKRVE
jgi:hypothetical protein